MSDVYGLPPGVDPETLRIKVPPDGLVVAWSSGVASQPNAEIIDQEGRLLCRGGPKYREALEEALRLRGLLPDDQMPVEPSRRGRRSA